MNYKINFFGCYNQTDFELSIPKHYPICLPYIDLKFFFWFFSLSVKIIF